MKNQIIKTPNGAKNSLKVISVFLIATFLLRANSFAQQCEKKEATGKKTVDCVFKESANEGNLGKIKEMVENDYIHVNARLKNEETALTIAAYRGHYDIVTYLIEKGANVHLRNNDNNTALTNASMQGHAKIVSLLLEKGAKINARGNSGKTALHFAVEKNYPEIVKTLCENGINIDAQDDYDRTAMVYASWRGNAEVIKTLVDKGADVNFQMADNNTILHNLTWSADAKAIETVLQAGANANALQGDGYLPLHVAVRNGNHDAVKVLVKFTKNINQAENHYGNTPLHIAAKNGDLVSFKILTEAGADHKIANNQNQTPLNICTQYGQVALINYSISQGLAAKADIKLAETNTRECLKNSSGDAKVYYCGQSGWVVATENSYLIFDYWSNHKLSENPGLVNGTINPGELKGKDVYVFASHSHSDHYDKVINTWQNELKNIHYILGFKPEETKMYKETGYDGPKYVFIKDNETGKAGNAKITTIKSNDGGQGFLVVIDGISIYHPGDHALFTEEDKPGFVKEVDFIANQNSNVDIAFLPVTGCPSRWKKEYIAEGFFYSIDKLNPKQVYPMHALNREYILKEFAELAAEKQLSTKIVCIDNSGDQSEFTKDMVAKK